MQNGKVGVALVNIGLNVMVSLVAVYGGYLIGQHFAPEVISQAYDKESDLPACRECLSAIA